MSEKIKSSRIRKNEFVSRICEAYESDVQNGHTHKLSYYLNHVAEGKDRDFLLLQLLSSRAFAFHRPISFSEFCTLYPEWTEAIDRVYADLPAEYSLPRHLGEYRVLDLLGEGGQARVVRAENKKHRRFAIKYSADPDCRLRLKREATFLHRLKHKNIVEVLGSGSTNEYFYITMRELRGQNLQDVRIEKLTTTTIVRILWQLCNAVAYVHSHNVLHRDIKPSNVHVDSDNIVRLLDFGLAIDLTTGLGPNAEVVEFHGTPQFMAPEQALGTAGNSEQGDVFSIGATLVWMLTGRPPFGSLQDAKSGRYTVTWLNNKEGTLEPLKDICVNATAYRTEDRYLEVLDIQRALDRYFPGERIRRQAMHARLPAALSLVILSSAIAIISLSDSPHPRWLRQKAELASIDLQSISPRDFILSFQDPSLLGGYRDNLHDPMYGGCYVEVVCEIASQLDLVPQIKFGDSWQKLNKAGENSYSAFVEGVADYTGPVSIRLATGDDRSETYLGPYNQNIDIATSLQSAQNIKYLAIKTKAVEQLHSLMEYNWEPESGWQLSEEYIVNYRYAIDHITVDRWIEFPISTFFGKPPYNQDNSRSNIDEIFREFMIATKPLRTGSEPASIHILVQWMDGTVSQFDTGPPPKQSTAGGFM